MAGRFRLALIRSPGIAALLNQTSTVLVALFAALFLKEPLTKIKLVAVGLAFSGAALVLYGGRLWAG